MPDSRSPLTGVFTIILLVTGFLLPGPAHSGTLEKQPDIQVPILLYHRFGPAVADSMTIRTTVFESHLRYLAEKNYTVIPLRRLINYLQGKEPSLPPNPVVIVADDGHISVYTDMLPLVKQYSVPVTLFIYPSAISNASYAMTWAQLRELKQTVLFDFQSHSYWHPNFKQDKKKMSPAEYEKSVEMQLRKSREKIEKELGVKVDMLAWPFGIYDDDLVRKGSEAGYIAAFTIERHHAGISDQLMTLPRYLLSDSDRGKTFEQILQGRGKKGNAGYH